MSYQKQKRIDIPVTRPFLPPEEEYQAIIDGIWERNWLTNNGPVATELEEALSNYLSLGDCELVLVSSGTIALQIAIKALGLEGEIITTPFSYVATTSSIVWEGCRPRFVDIHPETFNIDPAGIEAAVNEQTSAILATHVFGIPCDDEAIREVARRHGLPVIYDAAHAFGTTLNGRSLFAFGDVSTASFHATKLFHTVEGGALITGNKEKAERFRYMRNFGHDGPWKFNGVGINGKMSEFHAAMGLVNLRYADAILAQRKKMSRLYDRHLSGLNLSRPAVQEAEQYNHSYYPVLFANENELLSVQEACSEQHIQTRRYFYPSLSELDYVQESSSGSLDIAEDISRRILCLPLYHGMTEQEIETVTTLLKEVLQS